MSEEKTCSRCNGSGTIPCPGCSGTGQRGMFEQKGYEKEIPRIANCARCHGTGSVTCGACHGSGKK